MLTTGIHERATPQDPYLCDISTAGKEQIPGLKEMFTGSGRTAICAFLDHAEEYTIPVNARQVVDDVDTGKRNLGRIWLNPPPKPKEATTQKKKAQKAEQKTEQQDQPFEVVGQPQQIKSASPAEQQNEPTKQSPKEPKKRTTRSVRIGVPNRPSAPIVTR
jgi:hypothetical protein